MSTFILPLRNEVDLDDVPQELRDEMTFVPVGTIAEALRVSLPDEFQEVAQIDREVRTAVNHERIAAAVSIN